MPPCEWNINIVNNCVALTTFVNSVSHADSSESLEFSRNGHFNACIENMMQTFLIVYFCLHFSKFPISIIDILKCESIKQRVAV